MQVVHQPKPLPPSPLTAPLQVEAVAKKGSTAIAVGSSEAKAIKGGVAIATTEVSCCARCAVVC